MKLKIFSFLVLAACGADAALVTGGRDTPLVDAQGNNMGGPAAFRSTLLGQPGWSHAQVMAFRDMSPAARLEFLRATPGLSGVNYGLLQAPAPAVRHPAPAAARTPRPDLFALAQAASRPPYLPAATAYHPPAAAEHLRAQIDEEEGDMLAQALALSLEGHGGNHRQEGPAARRAHSHLTPIQIWKRLPFSAVQEGSGGMIDIGYDTHGRTDQYRGYNFPKAPMVHTYNPYRGAVEGEEHMWRGVHYVPHVSINLRARTDLFRARLPGTVRAAVNGIPSESLDIFWVVQDNPWTIHARPLFRPHYWLDPNAPNESGAPYGAAFRASVRILSSIPEGIVFNDPAMEVSTHGETPQGRGHVISSPENAYIPGAVRPDDTFSFWSLTQANGRNAITLHWFLDDGDNALILEAIGRSHSLEELLDVFSRIAPHRGSQILRSRLLPELDGFLDFHPRR